MHRLAGKPGPMPQKLRRAVPGRGPLVWFSTSNHLTSVGTSLVEITRAQERNWQKFATALVPGLWKVGCTNCKPIVLMAFRPAALAGHDHVLPQTISQVLSLADASHVVVNGWVRAVRRHKRIVFADLFDGSTSGASAVSALQVVFPAASAPDGLVPGCTLQVRGTLQRPSSSATSGGLCASIQGAREVLSENAQVLGHCDGSCPVQTGNISSPMAEERLRLIPHLRARDVVFARRMMLRAHMFTALRTFMANNGFLEVHPPCITSSQCESVLPDQSSKCESAGTNGSKSNGKYGQAENGIASFSDVSASSDCPAALALQTPSWGSGAMLTVSTQMHIESAACSGLNRVYALGPVWRAERHNTPRHLAEFYMLEVEACFVEHVEELMGFCASLVASVALALEPHLDESERVCANVLHRGHLPLNHITSADLHNALCNASEITSTPEQCPPLSGRSSGGIDLHENGARRGLGFSAISYADALEALGLDQADGIAAETERRIAAAVGPVFIHSFPAHKKPFYMRTVTGNNGIHIAQCFDLLLPGPMAEVAGGSLREDRLHKLTEAMGATYNGSCSIAAESPNLSVSSSAWYADLSRWGAVPHGGFGLGVDRLLAFILGVANVRDVVLFPRDVSAILRC